LGIPECTKEQSDMNQMYPLRLLLSGIMHGLYFLAISAIALPLHLDEVSNQEWYMLCEITDTSDHTTSKTEDTVVLHKMVMLGDPFLEKQQLSNQVNIPSDF
jgi:hypothetical protein